MNLKIVTDMAVDLIMNIYNRNVSVYIFGSALLEFNSANDLDLLVVGCDIDGRLLRHELNRLPVYIPFHLIILSKAEEEGLGFIEKVGAIALPINK